MRDVIEDVQRAGIEVRMCRVNGPVHDALVESLIFGLVGAQHFYDTVPAAKKGRAPDGLPARSPACSRSLSARSCSPAG
jgi:hypothetical protein